MADRNEITVPWSGRGSRYTENEIGTVAAAMRDADPLTQGRHQTEFEQRFAAYTGSRHAFAVSSCTAALELASLLCRLQPGDEVISPAHTFAATVIPFARNGAALKWADIDPDTRLVTAERIRPLIGPRTKVIIVVHLYGLVCDMDAILDLAREHQITVVEDTAQALGATYKGRHAGAIGDIGCFSLHSHKNITTLGEGGLLTLQSSKDADTVPGLRHNGMHAFSGERSRYWVPAMSNVDFDIEGVWPYNFCIGEVQCALGSKLLERIETINAERKVRAQQFITAVADFPELNFQKTPKGCGHSWHLLSARYDGQRYGKTRDDLISFLACGGVRAVVQYYPLYRYPMFQKAGFGEANCPETDRFFDNMISFPFQQWMPEKQFTTMISLVRDGLNRMRKGK